LGIEIMAAEQQDLWGAALAGLGKLWPSLLGAALSLRWMPKDSTTLQRAFSGAGGVGIAYMFGPATVELTGATSEGMAMAIGGLLAMFGLLVCGEIAQAMREVGLGAILRDFVRKLLRLGS
jgi:hypothetical protein